ncbi:sodium:solute symporter family protein [Acidobacteriota bacterium]
MNWIPLSIITVYILLLFVIAWSTRRLSRGGMLEYLLAGRGLPFWVVVFLLTGLAIGGASTVGVAERAYTSGISAAWYDGAWVIAVIIVGLVAAHKFRQLEMTTIPEFFERYYNVQGRVIATAGQIIIQIIILALQFIAGGTILYSLLPDIFSFQTGMLATAAVFVGVTLIGGFWSAGLTNIINVTLIYAGLIIGAVMVIGKIGGPSEFVARIPPSNPGFDIGGIGWGLVFAWIIVILTQAFSVQAISQISFAAKDAKAARKGFIVAGLFILPAGVICGIIGIAATILHPGITPTEAFPKTILSLSPFVAGLVLAGLWAAVLSTASALLVGGATLIVGDIFKRFIASDMDKKKERRASHFAILGMSLISYFIAISVSGILKTIMIALSLTAAYTLLLLMTIFWPKLCRRSHAVWTLLASMAAFTAWLIIPQISQFFNSIHLPHPIYLIWLVSIVTFIFISLVDKRKIHTNI